ncbi:hypothetical protein BD289DRAFT_371016 [Coniella lustricola]|uniref:Delta(24)-sterol reductase n=1 Tax=Coniella lustricola TaxID=2025994 RepID=A0A2T3A4D8_9PEZI|nr:hypothetical protein BD289DRAFT_371016 [Coniella lustricola]
MDRHCRVVADIAAKVRKLHQDEQPYRVCHGSSHSTRPRHGSKDNVLDIGMLSNVLSVDQNRQTVLVEPNVPMDRLVEATLACHLIPPVVMEFPGITVGGGFSGTSGESSSFRHGFFDDTVESVEMVLGNGDVVRASRQERPDLFQGAAGAVGTLGIVTLVEVRLVRAKTWVKTTYQRFDRLGPAIADIQAQTNDADNDYVDGIVFSRSHSVVITGQLTDVKPDDCPAQTFSDAGDPWFYLHVQDRTKRLEAMGAAVEFIPLCEYLFRYDRAGFWVGRQGYTYFKVVPFTRFFRWLLDDYSHTRTLYHALHASGISSQFVVQDLALPYHAAETFINWVDHNLGIWPIWLCPLRGCVQPTFHPVTPDFAGDKWRATQDTAHKAANISQPMLNIGVWGWGPGESSTFIERNRALEQVLRDLGGRKWLYSQTFYTEREFWDEYDWPWYQSLRKKYCATTLPTVYDKVQGRVMAEQKKHGDWKASWLSAWPIGGLYGMLLATISGDIYLHRQALWRHRKGTAGSS